MLLLFFVVVVVVVKLYLSLFLRGRLEEVPLVRLAGGRGGHNPTPGQALRVGGSENTRQTSNSGSHNPAPGHALRVGGSENEANQ